MDLGYNFKRDYNKTLNPRYIEFHDFNITYIDDGSKPTLVKANLENDFQIFGDKILDQNVTFVYGRAKSYKYCYDNWTSPASTPISVVVYSDPGTSLFSLDLIQFKPTNEYDWHLSTDHQRNYDDGNISLVSTSIPSGAIIKPYEFKSL